MNINQYIHQQQPVSAIDKMTYSMQRACSSGRLCYVAGMSELKRGIYDFN